MTACAAWQTNPANEKARSIVKVSRDGHGGDRVCPIRPGLWPVPSGMGGQRSAHEQKTSAKKNGQPVRDGQHRST